MKKVKILGWYIFFCSTEEIYVSIKSYQATAVDELSFDADVMLKVVEKTLDGWWLVRYHSNKIHWSSSLSSDILLFF